MRRRLSPFLLCLRIILPLSVLLVLGLAGPTTTQLAAQSLPSAAPRTATLLGWHDRLRVAVLDQRHAYGGLFFDRGLLRRFTPGMDHEYELDLLTYAFTPADDAAWYASPYAVRTYAGSIDKSRFATRTHFRADVPLGGPHRAHVAGLQQEDLTAQRLFVEIGYTYQLADRHRLGVSQTFASYKPDLDFTASYTYRTPRLGQARLSLGLLDVANNFIFDTVGVDPVLEDTTRSYTRRPYLFAVQFASPPVHRLHGELFAGIQPWARADVASQAVPANRFTWRQRLHYVGALLEVRAAPLTGGLIYRHIFTDVARHAPSGANTTSDFTSAQTEHRATAYVLATRNRWQGDLWLSYAFYRDRQQGTDFDQARLPAALDLHEGRLIAHLQVQHMPEAAGVRAGAAYLLHSRRFNDAYDLFEQQYLRFYQSPTNHRLVVQLGYQFRPGTYLLLGGAYDLDGDPFYDDAPRRYDGGFMRLALTW